MESRNVQNLKDYLQAGNPGGEMQFQLKVILLPELPLLGETGLLFTGLSLFG